MVGGVVGGLVGASKAAVEAARALSRPLRGFSQDQRRWGDWLGGIVVFVVVVAAAEAGVAAGAAAVVVSRCGVASDSGRKWGMYRIQRAKAVRIYMHTQAREYSNTFSLEHSARLVHFRQPELIPD